MLSWLLMLAAAPAAATTPIEAERAFAADAQAIGQWTAFRKWAADEAMMFVPQPVKAQDFLKDRHDPPKAIDWWPVSSFQSCDGSLAVNTGGWERPDGSVGFFPTVWQRQPGGGWKWIVDGGDALQKPRARPAAPAAKKASCRTRGLALGMKMEGGGAVIGAGRSTDATLSWQWFVWPDGSRSFDAWMWDGHTLRNVIADRIAGSPPNR